jgi:hypothetical protein
MLLEVIFGDDVRTHVQTFAEGLVPAVAIGIAQPAAFFTDKTTVHGVTS